MGFTSVGAKGASLDVLIDATYAPAVNVHDVSDLRELVRRGRHAWVYNNGMDRYSLGLHLYRGLRAGTEGRLEWIGLNTQGFAFNDLDGREPALGAFQVHDRLGLMPTPRWLAAREGLLDVRVRLLLDKLVGNDNPALNAWPLAPYQTDRDAWASARLIEARKVMVDRIRNLTR